MKSFKTFDNAQNLSSYIILVVISDHVTLMPKYGHKAPESACIPNFFVISIQKRPKTIILIYSLKSCLLPPASTSLFMMGLFGVTHGCGGAKRLPRSKICHKYPTLMKLGTVISYLKKIQKIHKSRYTPLEFCWHQHFFTENQQFLLYQEIQVQISF